MIKLDELEKQLTDNEAKGIYLLYGKEVFLLEQQLKKIKKTFGEVIKGINYVVIDDSNIQELISNIETPAFGYEKKLIIARNTGIFKREVKGRSGGASKELKDKINEYLKENIEIINSTTILIFVENEVEKNSIYNTIDKIGTICDFEEQKPYQIIKRIKNITNAYKVNVDESTLQYLIECCGTNMQELINEIRKLIEYAGENGTINKQDIDKLCIKKIESIIFDLTDNLGQKRVKEAMEVLYNLIASKEPIQKILISLYNHFKKLYFVKIAQENNKDIAVSLNLKSNQMFLVNKYKIQAKTFKKMELRKIIQELEDLDYKYKIGLIDLNIGLESILCTYCS
ncbi:MAG: DNA polymerase III subunit delta [Clostridia bacterium]|nr:DNA polymerase III subunit delta [Clostridia bacterium]